MAIHARAYHRLIINWGRYTWRVFATWECDTWVGLRWAINECERDKTHQWCSIDHRKEPEFEFDRLRRYASWMNDKSDNWHRDNNPKRCLKFLRLDTPHKTRQSSVALIQYRILDVRFNRIGNWRQELRVRMFAMCLRSESGWLSRDASRARCWRFPRPDEAFNWLATRGIHFQLSVRLIAAVYRRRFT